MKKNWKKTLAVVLCVCMVMGGFLGSIPKNVYASYTRYVNASTLAIRKKASASSKKMGDLKRGDRLTCYGTSGNWTKIKSNGKTLYVYTKYLVKKRSQIDEEKTTTATTATTAQATTEASNSQIPTIGDANLQAPTLDKVEEQSEGEKIVSYAKQFIGNPYVYGGNSLTNGVDCSGFTKAIYAAFGYNLPRTSTQQRSVGKEVPFSQAKPGDLICYSGHVAIYIGDNSIVHASNSKPYPQGGIKVTTPATYKTILSVRRICAQ